jgi:hypothetical protein
MKTMLAAVAVALLAGPAGAQAGGGVVTEMTPELVREAIAYGAKEKKLRPYYLGGQGGMMDARRTVATFTTPFLRVALAASEAKAAYKEFAEGDATPEMLAPELQIAAGAMSIGRVIYGVKTVVIVGPDGKVTQPDRSEERIEEFSNAYGAKDSARGVTAYFPLSAIREDAEVRVVMDLGKEQRAKFKLDKVR